MNEKLDKIMRDLGTTTFVRVPSKGKGEIKAESLAEPKVPTVTDSGKGKKAEKKQKPTAKKTSKVKKAVSKKVVAPVVPETPEVIETTAPLESL